MAKSRKRRPLAVEPGTVFGFRTSPLYVDSPSDTGRYGALIVLASDDDVVALGSLDRVWTSMPRLEDVEQCTLLRCERFGMNRIPAVFGCGVAEVPTMQVFTEIGRVALDAEQEEFAAKYMSDDKLGTSWSSPEKANYDVECEWRWEHDRDALLRERELDEKRRERERIAAAERYETRLKDLTWDILLSENPLSRWVESPPFPSAEFRDAAVARIHQTCRELQALGPKPRKPATRKILKDLVLWLNDADVKANWVIETEEREDLLIAIEEIAHVARHPSLMNEVGDWCEW